MAAYGNSEVTKAVIALGMPVFTGVVISWGLSGISIGQAFYYYTRYREDTKFVKWMVAIVMLMDLAHAYFLADFMYRSFIVAHNNVEESSIVPVTMDISIELSYFVPFIVQCFYAMRVWRVSEGNRPVTAIIAALAFTQFVAGIGTTTAIVKGKTSENIHSRTVEIWAAVENSMTVACDFLITGSLVYYLHKRKTGFKKTENIINKLIYYSVNLGLMTSIVVGLEIIFFLGFRGSWTFFIFHFPISKCYVNSLLALLNTRNNMRTIGSGSHSFSGDQA